MVTIDQTEKRVEEIIDGLKSTGSRIKDLKAFKQEIVKEIKKDKSMKEILEETSDTLVQMINEFLNAKNYQNVDLITGISYSLYMPSYIGDGSYTLNILGGNTGRKIVLPTELMQKKYPHSNTVRIDDKDSRNVVSVIGKDTRFDAASITKMFTLLLTYKLEEMGYIKLDDKISDLNPNFSTLGDFTVRDLIRLHGDIGTFELDENGEVKRDSDGKPIYARIDKLGQTTEEVYDILYNNFRVLDNTRKTNKYTDMGAIVLGDTLAKVVSRKLNTRMSFEEIMNKYIIKPLGLSRTCFNLDPNPANITGNISGNNGLEVQDGKARNLGGAAGHAGLLITANDSIILSDYVFKHPELAAKLGERTFRGNRRGNLGMYLKDNGYPKTTFVPREFSKGSFAAQGYTGSAMMFDPVNYIYNGIFVNTICEDYTGKTYKPGSNPELTEEQYQEWDGFMPTFERLQSGATREGMKQYVIKKYYNKLGISTDVLISRRVYKD